jgi:hypothetical protein
MLQSERENSDYASKASNRGAMPSSHGGGMEELFRTGGTMKIQARLTTGEIVELPKDCGCLDEIDVGPHWLHMDAYLRQKNQKAIKDAIAKAEGSKTMSDVMAVEALIHQVGQEEIARLEEKVRMMKRLGIEEIICDQQEQIHVTDRAISTGR